MAAKRQGQRRLENDLTGVLDLLVAHPAVASASEYTSASGSPAIRCELNNGRAMGVLVKDNPMISAEALLCWAKEASKSG